LPRGLAQTLAGISKNMDSNTRREYLLQKYLQLSPELKQAIFSVKNADIMQKLGEKYYLPIEKIQCLAKIAGLVLLGEIPIEQFESEIQKTCGFIPESAQAISQDIYQQIFQPVERFLQQAQKSARIAQEPNIKQELAEHGVEIRAPKQQDKYRESISELTD